MESYKSLLQRLLVAAILLFALWFCWTNIETLLLVLQFSFSDLLLILLCYFSFYLLTAAMACHMLKHRGSVVPLLQMLALNSWASLLGHITFLRAGYYSGKAYYYRQLYQVPITVSLGMMVFISLLTIFTNSLLGIIAGIWGVAAEGIVIPSLYWLTLGFSLLLCIGVMLGIQTLGQVTKLPGRVRIWVANLQSVFKSTTIKEVLVLMLMVAVTVPLQVVALNVLFSGFNLQVPLLNLVFVAIFSSLSLIISLTPANIGVRELVIILVIAHLDISTTTVLSILLVDRLLQFLLIFGLGLGGYHKLKHSKAQEQASI